MHVTFKFAHGYKRDLAYSRRAVFRGVQLVRCPKGKFRKIVPKRE